MLAGENPAQVGVEEALVAGRVDIVLGVGVPVMVAVLGGPPQDALLGRALSQQGKDELKHSAGAVSAMGEVAVVARSDGEHAKPVEGNPDPNRCPGHPRPDRPQAGEVNEHEGHEVGVEDVVPTWWFRGGVGCSHESSIGSGPCSWSPERGWPV